MSSGKPQPTIKVEHICSSTDDSQGSGNDHGRAGKSGRSSKAGRKESSSASPSGRPKAKKSSSNHKGEGQNSFLLNPLGESSLGTNLELKMQQRRKSSPCIGAWPGAHPTKSGTSSPKTPPNSCSSAGRSRVESPHLRPGKRGDSSGKYHQRRRLSSPPSFDPNAAAANDSSGSNHSSGHGSLQQLAIAGLNTSSTDIRANTVISGHSQIQTLYAPNNVTYPENISINVMNCPDNSTVQCDCGHINCPLCNLMMNLELTDPEVLK